MVLVDRWSVFTGILLIIHTLDWTKFNEDCLMDDLSLKSLNAYITFSYLF